MGFLTGCFLALLIGGLFAYATRARAPGPQDAATRLLEVYPSGRSLGTPSSLAEPVAVHFMAGVVGDDDRRDSARLEAILRLHAYAALRDVQAGAVLLQWTPARSIAEEEAVRAVACGSAPPDLQEGWLRSGVRPDPFGRPLRADRDLRVFLHVESDVRGGARIDAVVCGATGSETREVFEGRRTAEGPLLREIGVWLAATTGVADVEAFEEQWGREPAPRGPALGTYGDLLVASQSPEGLGAERPATSSLPEAARIVPEAAWLAAALGRPPEGRAEYLRIAATQRVAFTAALEDLAAEQLAAGRTELALATLARLSQDASRQRPVELLLAAQMVEQGRSVDARRLLDELPRSWRSTTAAARLHALALLAEGRPAAAERWALAWTEADPGDADGLVVHGRVMSELGRPSAAQGAWRRACRLDTRVRLASIVAWAAAADEEGLAELVAFLDELEDGDGIALAPELREVRAWAALRAGDPVRARSEYADLAAEQPDLQRLRRGACVAALRSGQEGVTLCDGLDLGPLASATLEAALASRSIGEVPGWPDDPTDAVLVAQSLAPRDSDVARSSLAVLASSEHATTDEQREALARWRIAVGAGVEAPVLPKPKDEAPD